MNEAAGACSPLVSTRGASESVCSAVEVVLGRVGNPRLLANERAGGRGCVAASGVNALDEGHAVEDAGAFGRDRLQLQPGDGGGVRGATGQTPCNHFAAAVALPGGAGVVRADLPVVVAVGEEVRH